MFVHTLLKMVTEPRTIFTSSGSKFREGTNYVSWNFAFEKERNECVWPDFQQQIAAAPPLAIHGATCETAPDYTKKKNVLRLTLTDGTEYLFMAHDQNEMTQWLSKIKFHAGEWRFQHDYIFQLIHGFA